MVYLGRVVCALWLWLSKSGFSAGEIGWSYAVPPLRRSCRRFWLAPSLTAFLGAKSAGGIDVRWCGADVFAAQQTTFAGFFPLLLAYSLTICRPLR